ncbi:high osmolarity signaling protein SHO1 [Lasiosphaeria hispida]|uniref:High osmolarity signaling protein SHO1 n=1 Tax=Lasiosphaeria hispida TaxID=260671 RepID=A0AAJ0HXS2_9PEZI|nr:high osmolarity signaling protein SHO1 [Lasiosphaeria hispida]
MPSYGSLHSPSLRKMENSRVQYGRKRISMGNVIGDPFALATISISALAWIISFFGAVFAHIQTRPTFPLFTWWTVVFYFFAIIGIFVVIASDSTQTYHVAIVGYLGCGLILSTSSVNGLIYTNNAAREAAAAGFILLAMVTIVWIFYFGSAPSAVPRAYIDSFALAKESSANRQTMGGGYGIGRPETSTSVQPPQMYTAQLNGLENPSPVGGMPSTMRNSALPPTFPAAPAQKAAAPTPGQPDTEIVPPTEYPYRAKAIYSYEANPDDANEISFSKHEILEVSDVSGRWWQARKENGQTGIAPSNYLILL